MGAVVPTGFAKRKYPRDLSYLMISKSMMDHMNPSHGIQIISNLSKYSRAPKQQQCKVYSYTSLVQHGLGCANYPKNPLEG
jgi:hypothetical protein